jgi:hypothetical protein
MRKRAYMYAREMVWNKVAESYMSTFVRVRSERIANNTYRLEYGGRNNTELAVAHRPSSVPTGRPNRISAA